MAMPNKLIAVDIFSSRVCVLNLKFQLGFINYKGVRNPEFQESAEIKQNFYQEYLWAVQNLLDPGAVEYVVPSDVPVKSDVFRSYYY